MNLLVTVGFVIAERVLYIPSLGCVLLIVYGIQLLWNAHIRHRQTIVGLTILLLITSSFRVVIRNRDWRSRESLLRAGLLTLPHNAKMHYNYGNFLRDTARPELAIAHYNVALRLWPMYASAHNNLGTLISNEAEAEEHFLAAIRYSADHVNAHYNLGQLYRKANRSSESEHMLKRCIRLEPTFTPAYIELARLGGPNNPSVGPLLIKVASLNPTDPYYITLYAHWLLDKGSYIKSIKYYWKALAASNFHQESMLGASRILKKFGQYSRLFQLITSRMLIASSKHRQIKKLLTPYEMNYSLFQSNDALQTSNAES
ncbi:protein O-mannosyl-transferase TMTC1-like isoform X2 [Photinus pyralis]|uniref:protein O-mannosyl-transferase TMTC1-like isoform X2 n=1 Tax=Photinus pyralis TaxID=7054 RepID=UPI0012671EBB|nr:protein O-mannosyl-transferase TMTC1-like isoform X2 [Photinus pyralis]